MINSTDAQHQIDTELLQRIARQDEHALERLYDRYSKLLFSVIFRVVRIREEAENILQEVFLQVWHRAETYNPRLGVPCIWLIQIARNKSIDYWRSKSTRMRNREMNIEDTQELNIMHTPADPHEVTSLSQVSKLVQDALNRLPEHQRELIELAYYEGYNQTELAEKFAMPLGTVKSRMRAGLMALREQFTSMPDLLH